MKGHFSAVIISFMLWGRGDNDKNETNPDKFSKECTFWK